MVKVGGWVVKGNLYLVGPLVDMRQEKCEGVTVTDVPLEMYNSALYCCW